MLSTAAWRPVAASHSSTVRAPCPIVARSEPSGENATPSMLRTAPRECTRTVQRSAPAGTSRAIRSPSMSPTTTRLPSGLRATAFTTARRPATSRTRAAALLVKAGLGAGLVALGWIATSYLRFRGLGAPDDLLARVHLLGIALAAAGVVALLMLVRRVKYNKRAFRRIDLLSLAGAGVALTLGVIWLVGDDSRLRPCRLGNDAACDIIATRLLESAERTPTAPPTRWEEDAARVLDRYCRGPEPGPCAVHRYAVGSVALRAGRIDAARQAFLRACDEDPSWCARAAQETALPWTREERARLERHR